MRILIAEDSQTQAVDLRRRLEGMGHDVVVTTNGREAWDRLRSSPETLVISDWQMPEMNGLDLCRKIRAELKCPYVYLILLTSKSHRHERLQGLNAGADDFLTKPIDNCELEIAVKTARRIIAAQEILEARARELEQANQALASLALKDDVTELKNARGLREALAAAFRQAIEDQLPLSLVQIELEPEGKPHESLEPAAWRTLLPRAANLLRKESRSCDILARIREHGFGLILPGLATEQALMTAELLRTVLDDEPWGDIALRAYAGVATMFPDRAPADESQLQACADTALAAAREHEATRLAHQECTA